MDAHLKGGVLFRPTEEKDPRMFMDDKGNQIVPKMELSFGVSAYGTGAS